MKNNKNVIWALVGLLVLFIVGGYIYGSDPLGWRGGTETVGQQAAETTPDATGEGSSAPSVSDLAQTEQPQQPAGEAPAPEASVVLPAPTFDLVRVEPDGSTLIAGQAVPGTAVEVIANGQVIVTTQAGASGDFAVVLDDRLPPGNHEIILRILGEGEIIALSEEIATISIPESDPGELLVMVTKPGEASRILTAPEVASSSLVSDAASANATAAVGGEQADTTETSAGLQEDQSGNETAASDTAQTASVPLQDASGQEADATGSQQSAGSGDSSAEAQTEIAALEPGSNDTAVDAAKSQAVIADAPRLRIDAVEIEDGRMFVAGSATPGTLVRVYANGEQIGSSNVSASGRFLVEAARDLAVGNHTISADLITQPGSAPSMRVEVPFTRPEGTTVAAVAASDQDNLAASGSSDLPGTTSGGQQSDGGDSEIPQITVAETLPAQTSQEQSSSSEQNSAAAQSGNNGSDAAAATQRQVAAADVQSDEPETIVQPALEQSDGSVIIRRGDTLWQISRRIYGRGVRYTTIYLANQSEIENPDIIEPGQIFAVPEEPLENSEELHRQRIRTR
ncbi:MAG: LysM peptidoglycan-binding domain-containing protein [Pseudomonadota bacterium]